MKDEEVQGDNINEISYTLRLLYERASELGADASRRSTFDAIWPEDAWNALAVRFGRPDLVGKFLSYDAGEALAALCLQSRTDPQIDGLFMAAGLAVYLKPLNDRVHRLYINNDTWFCQLLGLAPSVSAREVLERFSQLPKVDALKVLRALLPAAAALFSPKELAFVYALYDAARWEGIDVTGGASMDLSDIRQAIYSLFRNAGFPLLDSLNEEQVCDAVAQVPRRLARLIKDLVNADKRTRVFLSKTLRIERDSKAWQVLFKAAERVPSLQELASNRISVDSAWREVCTRVGFGRLADCAADPQARFAVEVESIAAELPDALIEATRLDALVRRPDTQSAAEQRRAWRKLAMTVGKEKLVSRTDDAAARKLAAAALTYTGNENIGPLVHKAGLAELQRRESVRAIAAGSRKKGKQVERTSPSK